MELSVRGLSPLGPGATTYSPSHTGSHRPCTPIYCTSLTGSPGPGASTYSPSHTGSHWPGTPIYSPSLTESQGPQPTLLLTQSGPVAQAPKSNLPLTASPGPGASTHSPSRTESPEPEPNWSAKSTSSSASTYSSLVDRIEATLLRLTNCLGDLPRRRDCGGGDIVMISSDV